MPGYAGIEEAFDHMGGLVRPNLTVTRSLSNVLNISPLVDPTSQWIRTTLRYSYDRSFRHVISEHSLNQCLRLHDGTPYKQSIEYSFFSHLTRKLINSTKIWWIFNLIRGNSMAEFTLNYLIEKSEFRQWTIEMLATTAMKRHEQFLHQIKWFAITETSDCFINTLNENFHWWKSRFIITICFYQSVVIMMA